ncbi:MAG: CehA/McbA family metallohydrolase [Isosphaeraceae bacterium]|nr:CehA/McbA family metallohydrolase [Isosphaeraceae bacterium]
MYITQYYVGMISSSQAFRSAALGLMAIALTLFSSVPAAAVSDSTVSVPPLDRWTKSGVDVGSTVGGSVLRLTRMFEPGGLRSPTVAVSPGERLTFSATVETEYKPASGYYLCWLELEFLAGDRVAKTVASSPIRGTAPEQTLAVTGVVPEGSKEARVAIRLQNRISQVLPNAAKVLTVRLARLGAGGAGPIVLKPMEGLPDSAGSRVARVTVSGDWPDGSAVALATTRGAVTPSVVLSGGRGQAVVTYGAGDVGEAELSASIAERSARLVLADPHAGRLVLRAVEADDRETPALVQLVQGGKVRPGRYSSIPGEFARGAWSTELAPGAYVVRVTKGPMFEAIERAVTIEAGHEVDLGRVTLRRRVDLRRLGWYGGDPDGDVYHGQRIYNDVTAETAERIGRAVGLDWITPANWGEPEPKTWKDARAEMDRLSSPDLLFRFADEKKWHIGHFCFVGLDRPDGEGFDAFWDVLKRLNPSEGLQAVRTSGATTFANHPVRYWMSGVNHDTFVTNMYVNMPFDVAAGGLLDGVNVNEGGENALKLWSLLLDHGYRVAATAGADFSLDHPGGWLPGLSRLYVHAPGGLNERAIVTAIRAGRTIVSTGPMLVAALDDEQPPGAVVATGKPHRISARGWARSDRPDRLKRVELWAHDRVQQARELDGTAAEVSFDWAPAAEHDWVAVRLVTESGWALSSAFHAVAPGWEFPKPVTGKVAVNVVGLSAEQRRDAKVEVWDNRPDAPGAKVVRTAPLDPTGPTEVDAPVTATIRLVLADGRQRDVRFFDVSGVSKVVDVLSQGAEKDAPLLRWETYADVLRRCRNVTVEFKF